MPRYYGTARPGLPGEGKPGYGPLPSLAEEDWCEESGVPRRDCEGCRQEREA